MRKKIKIIIPVLVIIIIGTICLLSLKEDNEELKTIKSEKQLLEIYEGDPQDSDFKDIFLGILTSPFSFLQYDFYDLDSGILDYDTTVKNSALTPAEITADSINTIGNSAKGFNPSASSSSKKNYSTTNIQVENVDEADITKTDGDYIYSISNNNVIITNVQNPKEIKIEATINGGDNLPVDLLLYNNKLVVISSKIDYNSSYYYYGYTNNGKTFVEIYDISDKSEPNLLKNYELDEQYYTSRCINSELYIISSGNLKKDGDIIKRTYTEDRKEKEIELNNIKYLKDVKTNTQTLIATTNLDNVQSDIKVSSYLIDVSNAYVSENAIYLLDQKYEYNDNELSIKKLFGIKGVIGLFEDYDNYNYNSQYYTEIYKFGISTDGEVKYNTKSKVEGQTINQYSLDEKNNHLRIALYDRNGARVAILDENLKQIGISDNLAKGEKMYSSRFMGDKAYLVTYRTVDPLFVIDLSNESKPQVLGELKIPGYSTYLHPYDENHIIGIGMQTRETVNRDSYGKIRSTTARITGMKMALFDVTNVNNPKQISETIIGDSRTISAILTNPKALLFSKEKELIAIPVNNYSEDFEIDSSENYSSLINSYTNYNKEYISEGYLVYKINLEDGFKLKGTITHEKKNNKTKDYYYYGISKMLRGLYIDDNLYTVSEKAVKVNNIDTLELLDEMKIEEE